MFALARSKEDVVSPLSRFVEGSCAALALLEAVVATTLARLLDVLKSAKYLYCPVCLLARESRMHVIRTSTDPFVALFKNDRFIYADSHLGQGVLGPTTTTTSTTMPSSRTSKFNTTGQR